MRRFTKIYARSIRPRLLDSVRERYSAVIFFGAEFSGQEDRAGIKCDRDGDEKRFRRL
jgi:hypothetical protein